MLRALPGVASAARGLAIAAASWALATPAAAAPIVSVDADPGAPGVQASRSVKFNVKNPPVVAEGGRKL